MKPDLKSDLCWHAGAGLLYAAVLIYCAWPVFAHSESAALGLVCDDFFDEMVLTGEVYRSLAAGKLPLGSSAISFPENHSLLITHKSYLQTLLGCFWKLMFEWPLWWNLEVLSSIWLSCTAVFWSVSRICRSRLLAFLCGLPLIFSHYTCQQISWGHIPQLLNAFTIAALGAMAVIFKTGREKRDISSVYFWILGVCTVCAVLVYLINFVFLGITGFILLLCCFAELSGKTKKRLIVCAGSCALILIPALICIIRADHDVAAYISSDSNAHTVNSFINLHEHSIFPPLGHKTIVLNWAGSWISWLITAGFVLFFILNYRFKLRSNLLNWLAAAAALGCIAMGPYLMIGSYTILNGSGEKILAPLAYLLMVFKVLRYWRCPDTASAAGLCASALACGYAFNLWAENKKKALNYLLSLPCLALFLIFSFSCVGVMLFANSPVYSGSYYVCSQLSAPVWCRYVRDLPEGAVLDFPVGYCTNVWTVQFLHGHPSASDKRYVTRLNTQNAFVNKLLMLTDASAAPYNPDSRPSNDASEVFYGRRLMPRMTAGFIDNKYAKERICIVENEKNEVIKDIFFSYKLLYDDGMRYFILHKSSCWWVSFEHGEHVYDNLSAWLDKYCGETVYKDSEVSVYRLPDPDKISPMLEYLNKL